MDEIAILGLVAACLTTGAYLPQVVKTWRTRSTEDISLITFVALVVGQSLWLGYGIIIANVPLIFANAISSFLTANILYVKLRNVVADWDRIRR